MTKQKQLILDIVNSACEHYTAEQIFALAQKEMPSIARATVYNNLNALLKDNLIRKICRPNQIVCYDKILPAFKKLVEKRGDKEYYVRGTFTNKNLDFADDAFSLYNEGFDQISVEPVVGDSDEYALAQQIVEKTGVTYENVIAPGAFDQFINKLAGVPTTVFIDKNGTVVGEAVVGAKVEEYKQHVEDYLNEQK